jgi:hypothetical protein
MSLNLEVPYNQAAGLYLPLTGGALTGPLALGANKITGVANGTAATDAATFGQVQTTEAALNPALQYNDLLGWTFEPGGVNTSGVLASAATIYLARIPLPVALTVTNVLMINQSTGLVLSHSFAALFMSNGVIVGQTADQSIVWGTGGPGYNQRLALSGGPYICTPLAANDFVWAAIYVGTSTGTLPAFDINNAYFNNMGPVASRSRFGSIAQANTATLGNIIPANITPSAAYSPWMAIS